MLTHTHTHAQKYIQKKGKHAHDNGMQQEKATTERLPLRTHTQAHPHVFLVALREQKTNTPKQAAGSFPRSHARCAALRRTAQGSRKTTRGPDGARGREGGTGSEVRRRTRNVQNTPDMCCISHTHTDTHRSEHAAQRRNTGELKQAGGRPNGRRREAG